VGNLLSLMLQIGQFAGGGDTQSSGFIAAYDLATGKFDGLLDCSRGRSESSSRFREHGWTLGVVDGESILPNLGLLLSQDEAWRKINGRIGGRR